MEPDNNVWMKDYTKPPVNSRFESLEKMRKGTTVPMLNSSVNTNSNNNLNSNSVGSFNSNRTSNSKNLDLMNIYKGMSYDEWVKIRDSFLKSHNMV